MARKLSIRERKEFVTQDMQMVLALDETVLGKTEGGAISPQARRRRISPSGYVLGRRAEADGGGVREG